MLSLLVFTLQILEKSTANHSTEIILSLSRIKFQSDYISNTILCLMVFLYLLSRSVVCFNSAFLVEVLCNRFLQLVDCRSKSFPVEVRCLKVHIQSRMSLYVYLKGYRYHILNWYFSLTFHRGTCKGFAPFVVVSPLHRSNVIK